MQTAGDQAPCFPPETYETQYFACNLSDASFSTSAYTAATELYAASGHTTHVTSTAHTFKKCTLLYQLGELIPSNCEVTVEIAC